MSNIPKPKHCGENWLDMKPSDNGRLCAKCTKSIVDFSKMNWSQIKSIQRANDSQTCGMYRRAQLKNWGREIPTSAEKLQKATITAGLVFSSVLPVSGQTMITTDGFSISGKIVDKQDKEPLPGANITFKNTIVAAQSDVDGNFTIEFKKADDMPIPDTLTISYVGFKDKQIAIKDLSVVEGAQTNEPIHTNGLMVEMEVGDVIAFYVTRPNFFQRLKWKVKRLFRKDD